jgi:hypothetical protein
VILNPILSESYLTFEYHSPLMKTGLSNGVHWMNDRFYLYKT